MVSSDENNSGNTPQKKRKAVAVHRQQKFRSVWQNEADFIKWLVADPRDVHKAKCKLCNTSFTADITVIRNHAKSNAHVIKIKSSTSQKSLMAFMAPAQGEQSPLSKSIKRAEIKMCGFMVEHNVPFDTMNHLCDLMKDCFPDSEIAKNLKLKSTKCKAIVKNVLGITQKNILADKLKSSLFSVMIDESTDISATKTLYIVVRYYDAEEGRVLSRFWELIQLFGEMSASSAATAEHIYKCIEKSFEAQQIPLKNIIGFGSDGCNTMMGAHNSVASRFQASCPGIYIFKCICHSLHLCASEACKILPRSCEDLARNVYNFFKASAKRQHEFSQFQKILDIEIHKILHPAQTRWLSLKNVVARMIEQWEALKVYFLKKQATERLLSVDHIITALTDPLLQLFYLFLDWVLPQFTKLNQLFQSEKTVIADMYESVCSTYTELLKSYMDRDYINRLPLQEINPLNTEKFLPYQQVYLGVKVMTFMQSSTLEVQKKQALQKSFYDGSIRFLSVSCFQIKQRFDFSNVVLQKLFILKPSNAMSERTRKFVPSLLPLMQSLPRLVKPEETQEIDSQWRRLSDFELPDEIGLDTDVDMFWKKLLNYNSDVQTPHFFKNLAKFALSVLSLPHSNAECERIFSKVNLIKTKLRNKLVTSTINASILASQRMNHDCRKFEPTSQDYSRMSSSSLYPKKDDPGPSSQELSEEVEEEEDIYMPNYF